MPACISGDLDEVVTAGHRPTGDQAQNVLPGMLERVDLRSRIREVLETLDERTGSGLHRIGRDSISRPGRPRGGQPPQAATTDGRVREVLARRRSRSAESHFGLIQEQGHLLVVRSVPMDSRHSGVCFESQDSMPRLSHRSPALVATSARRVKWKDGRIWNRVLAIPTVIKPVSIRIECNNGSASFHPSKPPPADLYSSPLPLCRYSIGPAARGGQLTPCKSVSSPRPLPEEA